MYRGLIDQILNKNDKKYQSAEDIFTFEVES